jgi:nucleoside-diphosphate-sugar epimerase
MTDSPLRQYCQSDLEYICNHTQPLWHSTRGCQFFMTGGTGFFGKWLLESFHCINQSLSLDAKLVILSRDPASFLKQHPYLLKYQDIQWLQGDITEFDLGKEKFDYVIHGATQASAHLNHTQPLTMFHTIVQGTTHLLEQFKEQELKGLLYLSSGAVYGRQPEAIDKIPESFCGGAPALDSTASAYGEGKRAAELLCQLYHQAYQMPVKIARCFAFVGPYLPLDQHFAIGNFIRNALLTEPITLTGDGSAVRSYLYVADLCVWLWTILLRGPVTQAFNVGSDQAISILELAKLVSARSSRSELQITALPPSGSSTCYVPSIVLAQKALGLTVSTPLIKAIDRTMQFVKNSRIGI